MFPPSFCAYLGDILNNVVPHGLDKYADQKLFEPLGIRKYKWQYTPTNVPNTAGGIRPSMEAVKRLTEIAREYGIYRDYHIVESPMLEQDIHFTDSAGTPTGWALCRGDSQRCSGSSDPKQTLFVIY